MMDLWRDIPYKVRCTRIYFQRPYLKTLMIKTFQGCKSFPVHLSDFYNIVFKCREEHEELIYLLNCGGCVQLSCTSYSSIP